MTDPNRRFLWIGGPVRCSGSFAPLRSSDAPRAPADSPGLPLQARLVLQVLIDVPEPLSEIAAMLVESAGASGVEIRDETTLTPPGGVAVPMGRCHVLAWIDIETDREALSGSLLAELDAACRRGGFEDEPASKVSLETVDAEDWVRKVRDSIRPVRVGRRVRIRPSWTPASPSSAGEIIEIVLDPGLAFGTGHHATTALCLEALEELLDEALRAGLAPRVLDVGTGSGILAIAAALLGADRCVGIDNDPMAVRVAGENSRENGVEDRVTITSNPSEALTESFEIVVANIHLGPLTELAPQVAEHVAPGGRLLLSGLLTDQADAAEAAYMAQGLARNGRRARDGWSLVSLIRRIR